LEGLLLASALPILYKSRYYSVKSFCKPGKTFFFNFTNFGFTGEAILGEPSQDHAKFKLIISAVFYPKRNPYQTFPSKLFYLLKKLIHSSHYFYLGDAISIVYLFHFSCSRSYPSRPTSSDFGHGGE